jgi:hypothetical protein
MTESMEMEETLMDKNESAIFKNGLLELKEHNNRLYIFKKVFYVVKFFGLELCLF